jgi:hypothetical protein
MSWSKNPLAEALFALCRRAHEIGRADEFKEQIAAANDAMEWASEQDAEVERIAARITAEVKAELAQESES